MRKEGHSRRHRSSSPSIPPLWRGVPVPNLCAWTGLSKLRPARPRGVRVSLSRRKPRALETARTPAATTERSGAR